VTMTGAQFNSFSTSAITADEVILTTPGTYDASTLRNSPLIGASFDTGMTLRASLFGNDTLIAGGDGNILEAGEGVDTLIEANDNELCITCLVA
jgi:hypothetical protein